MDLGMERRVTKKRERERKGKREERGDGKGAVQWGYEEEDEVWV